jgi:hypothetical protein
MTLCSALGLAVEYASADQVRAGVGRRFGHLPGMEGVATLPFARPMSARNWLQASNPSERWKWDFMFQDLPPVKGAVDPASLPAAPGIISLREVK